MKSTIWEKIDSTINAAGAVSSTSPVGTVINNILPGIVYMIGITINFLIKLSMELK